jgi:hypothetical protein
MRGVGILIKMQEVRMLIEVTGRNGGAMWIEASRVLAVVDKPPAMCLVCMACNTESEEWTLGESAESVRRKVDSANPTGERTAHKTEENT